MNSSERAAVLAEALPYIKAFAGKTVVVKYDGNAITSQELREALISDLVLLSLVGVHMVVVHGDEGEVDTIIDRLRGSHTSTADGSSEQAEAKGMVLAGKINKELTSLINAAGGKAVGISGLDGSLFLAEEINPALITDLIQSGYIPVVAALAQGQEKGSSQLLDANDTASRLAVTLKAAKLILLSNTVGICYNEADDQTLISELRLSVVGRLLRSRVIAGERAKMVDCCVQAIRRGVPRAHILDGRVSHSIIVEMLTDSGIGTMILQDYEGGE
ncbi:MAG: acetylglutamate kinase [Symbiobacteriaceae bacterium]|nr:acetylglutamate kinase [Symbiobacteriaceae bacterium]